VSFRVILSAGAKIVLLEGALTFSAGFDPVASPTFATRGR
jgi:hypothetical protein